MKKNKPKKQGVDRMDRIGLLIHRTIARLLAKEFKDPRIEMVTVNNVEVSRDLAHAKVYITVLDESRVKETLAVLNNAASFFRSAMAEHLKLRVIPRPRFIFDESVLVGNRMENLLKKTHNNESALPAAENGLLDDLDDDVNDIENDNEDISR